MKFKNLLAAVLVASGPVLQARTCFVEEKVLLKQSSFANELEATKKKNHAGLQKFMIELQQEATGKTASTEDEVLELRWEIGYFHLGLKTKNYGL